MENQNNIKNQDNTIIVVPQNLNEEEQKYQDYLDSMTDEEYEAYEIKNSGAMHF